MIARIALLGLVLSNAHAAGQDAAGSTGERLYNYHCYQCHGYAGDARTLASTMLDPQPRAFTAADPDILTRSRMIGSVSNGRPGTAMSSFAASLGSDEIEAVVDYVRARFMSGVKPALYYHTADNGWANHDRYRAAFPFARGEVALDTPWHDLTAEQRNGRQIYMQACISCHDRATVRDEGAIWELHALSYPRKHYTRTAPPDATSGASPYALHDRVPAASGLSAALSRGEQLYQDNCAFCHAADGTARNWIGSFLEPRPRNLGGEQISATADARLKSAIREGLPGTSMPAWKHVLDDRQIDDIIAYIRRVLQPRDTAAIPDGSSLPANSDQVTDSHTAVPPLSGQFGQGAIPSKPRTDSGS